MHQAGLTIRSVWIHYLSIGGNADEFELDAYLHGSMELPPVNRNMVSYAVNELISDIPRPFAPYDDTHEDS